MTKANAEGLRKNSSSLKRPTQTTLDKYGLSYTDWLEIAQRQEFVCAICHKLPKSGRLNIDHEHVKGWKKMPPEQRKIYVRGLLCYMDNKYFMARGMSVVRAINIKEYIERYQDRTFLEPKSAAS